MSSDFHRPFLGVVILVVGRPVFGMENFAKIESFSYQM